MLGSPRVTNATSSPASRCGVRAAAAARCDARRSPATADMSKTSRSTVRSGATWRTIDSARPTTSGAREGATTRSAWWRARTAWSVTVSGSPGPTPMPTRRPGGGGGHGVANGAAAAELPAWVAPWVAVGLGCASPHGFLAAGPLTEGRPVTVGGWACAPDSHRVTRSGCAVDPSFLSFRSSPERLQGGGTASAAQGLQ